jgi:hypothetical protein
MGLAKARWRRVLYLLTLVTYPGYNMTKRLYAVAMAVFIFAFFWKQLREGSYGDY